MAGRGEGLQAGISPAGSRGERRPSSSRHWAAGCLALVLLLAPTAAPAKGGVAIRGYKFPSIVVIGNGQAYTGVSGIGYAWEVSLDVDTGASGRIKEWRIWPTLTIEGESELELKTHGHREWYPSAADPWPRPKHVSKSLALLFPDVVIQGYVVAACNRNADRLRQAGESNATIFGRAHQLPATTAPQWWLDLTVGGDTSSEAFFPVPADIVCAKWAGVVIPPPKGSGDVAAPMEVRNAKLVVFPSQHSGGCPVQLSLFGRVTSNGFGSFESWVESTEGWKSTKTARNIDVKADGEYEDQFTEKVVIPIVRPAGQGGHGPASGQVGGSGQMATPKRPIDPVPGQGKPPASPGGGVTTGTPSNVHRAAVRLVAHGGGKTVASGWQDYAVTCDPKVTPGLAPFDALAAEVRVTQASLAVSPRTNPLGKCEVELRGKITTNVAFADVTLAYRNHKGVTTPAREVTTGANREASFTDTLDFGKDAGGLWIEQGGTIGPGSGQAGPYAGSFQIVGQSVAFQSSPAAYSFTCVNPAPGGIAQKPGSPKTNFPPVGPLAEPPRDADKGAQSGSAKAPGSPSAAKPPPVSALATHVDFAAVTLVLTPAGSSGAMLTARITNVGTAAGAGEYRIVVKDSQGQIVFEKSGRARLDPDEQHGISERVPSSPRRRLTATLSVQAPGDINASNNEKTVSALLP